MIPIPLHGIFKELFSHEMSGRKKKNTTEKKFQEFKIFSCGWRNGLVPPEVKVKRAPRKPDSRRSHTCDLSAQETEAGGIMSLRAAWDT